MNNNVEQLQITTNAKWIKHFPPKINKEKHSLFCTIAYSVQSANQYFLAIVINTISCTKTLFSKQNLPFIHVEKSCRICIYFFLFLTGSTTNALSTKHYFRSTNYNLNWLRCCIQVVIKYEVNCNWFIAFNFPRIPIFNG